jgi:hypothetical protein
MSLKTVRLVEKTGRSFLLFQPVHNGHDVSLKLTPTN